MDAGGPWFLPGGSGAGPREEPGRSQPWRGGPTGHASKVMLKILQARPQQYVNRELPDVQAGFRKGRGTRDQIANIQ